MNEDVYNKKLSQIKRLQTQLVSLSNRNLDKKSLESLLKKFPTRVTSKILKATNRQVTSLKRQIKDLYLVDGEENNINFKKSISLLYYVLQIQEHKLNNERFWADLEKNKQEVAKRYFEEEKQQKELREKTQKEDLKRQRLTYEHVINKFVNTYKNRIEKFLKLANIKVSNLDEYGQPSWENLYIEIGKFVVTLAKENDKHFTNHQIGLFRRTRNYDVFIEPYNHIALYLEKTFKNYFDPSTIKNSNLNDLSGIDFEGYVAQLLKEIGATDICGTLITGDQGADLLFKIGSRRIAAQVKRHFQHIGNKAVQEIVGALRYYNADDAWVITNTTFTPSAVALAQKNDVSLIDGQILLDLTSYLEKSPKYAAFLSK